MPSWLNFDSIVIIVSALLAFGTFVGIALPLVLRSEKKEKYRNVIDKKRRQLYEEAKEELVNRAEKHKNEQAKVTAAQSVVALYRLQSLAGNASKTARKQMLQAGIRNPKAPLIYLLSRIVVPIVFTLIAMMFLSAAEGQGSEMSSGLKGTIILGSAFVGFFLPRILIKNTADKRQQEIQLAFPDALDMMLICVQGGIGIEGAIVKIAETIPDLSETLAEELGILSAELGMLTDRKLAFQGFAERVGSSSARTFSTAMLQAEQYGTSVTKAMRVLADESRQQRMAAAEQKAASLPPKLTVPMILFFLPALFVTILGPAFLSTPQ